MYYLVIGAIFLIFLYLRFKKTYWEERGIPGPKPWPIIGNIGANFIGQKTLGEVFFDIYRKYEGYPFVGLFRAKSPCLLVRDPELVQRILVKDFKFFRNNEMYVDRNVDILLGFNPFVLRDQEWKDTRQMLTPGFTSGRLKGLFPIITSITQEFVRFIEHHPNAHTEGIETRLLTKRFTSDNVAKAAFGIDGKAFESYDNMSDFMQMANSFFTPGTIQAILLQIVQIFPASVKYFPIKLVPTKLENQIVSIIVDVKRHRTNNDAVHKDYLQFLLELNKEKKFSDKEITAHASTFFFDGYFTSSLVLSYILLCLAQNPEYQERVREEIRKVEENNNGEITYEGLQEMELVNACFFESLRMYPVLEMLTKVCTEPYEYTCEDPDFKKMTVSFKPNDVVILPYGMFGKDPKYFKDPEKFYPERMMDKDGTTNRVFFPFGLGPRVCIGQRLGIMQVKIGLVHVIKNFEVTISPKLQQPIKMHPFNFMNEVKGGVWLRYKKIKN
ncbi:probable cytochrome P450 28d1 [Sitophilus oryzae]|uniref:Probable cytochrome P450 28d1 n=1 Tax=Sitophilus oryzae TaxID=7048 RepID=A0A6J2YAY2_SITOR|nr:probable cytochrome P450 28d1 [Sitophilus oryzae]QTM97441.1 Cytochrome P450 [Sitophilus oryzae]